MQFFLDTANLEELKTGCAGAGRTGPNPALIARESVAREEQIRMTRDGIQDLLGPEPRRHPRQRDAVFPGGAGAGGRERRS